MNPMGNENRLESDSRTERLPLGAQVAIVAREVHLDALRLGSNAGWLGDSELIPVAIDEELDPSILRECDVAVVEVDPSVASSMDRIDIVRRYDPELPLVVAMPRADISLIRTLVRAGVSDVVSVPLSAEELLQCIVAIAEVKSAKVAGKTRLAPVIAVSRAMGGCGATTIATHLAAALGDSESELSNVCLLDLDIQFGRVSEMVDLAPRRNLSDLMKAGERLDAAFLRSVATEHDAGFSVVAAPPDIDPIEDVDARRLDAVVRTARREFGFVIADMPTDLTNWGLSFLSSADQVLLVVEPKVAAIRQAKRRLDLFRNLGLDMRLISIVLNKSSKRLFSSISTTDIEEALHRDILATLQLDEKNVPTAQEQGLLAYQWKAKSPFWGDMVQLTDKLLARLDLGDAE